MVPAVRNKLKDLAERLSKLLDGRGLGQEQGAGSDPGDLGDYQQPPVGLVERLIGVAPQHVQGAPCSTYQALVDYPIRDFGKGIEAVDAIVRHVLGSKLKHKREPREGLWQDTVCVRVSCSLIQRSSGLGFDELKPKSVGDVADELAGSDAQRVKDIESYAALLAEGTELGPPIYVSGAVLNALMGSRRAAPRAIYMLDGARRICAAALAHRSAIDVLLILQEDQLPDLLSRDDVEQLKQRLRSLTWFNSYQSIPQIGLHGERSLRRFKLMAMDRLRDQVVLDFGCNVGAACMKAAQAGAKRVVGIEGMPDTCALAKDIGQLAGFEALEYHQVNFNDSDFDAQIDAVVPEQADYAFFFSVYRTKELTQRERLFRYIIAKARKGIFFEGHADADIDTRKYHDWLFECFGLKHRFLGYSEGNLRPLFFVERA